MTFLGSADPLDLERPTANDDPRQVLQYMVRNLRWQTHQRVVVADIDTVDLATVHVPFVRQRTDNIARLYAMSSPNFKTKDRLRPLRSTRPRRFFGK
jgi:hypothetical protein